MFSWDISHFKLFNAVINSIDDQQLWKEDWCQKPIILVLQACFIPSICYKLYVIRTVQRVLMRCKQRVTIHVHVHVHSGKTMTTDPKIQIVAGDQDTCQPYSYYLFCLEFSKKWNKLSQKEWWEWTLLLTSPRSDCGCKASTRSKFFLFSIRFFLFLFTIDQATFFDHVNKNLFH